jgi:hypothetical protein
MISNGLLDRGAAVARREETGSQVLAGFAEL